VCDPAPQKELVGASAYAILKLVVGGGHNLHVQTKLAPDRNEEFVLQQGGGRSVAGVEGKLQRLARLRIYTVLVAGFGQQCAGAGDVRLAKWILVFFVVAEDGWWQRRLRRHTAAVEE